MLEYHLCRSEARTSEAQTTRLKGDHFNFKTNCLLCSKEVKLEFLVKYHNDVKELAYCIRQTETNESILEIVCKRGDAWGAAHITCNPNASDVVATDTFSRRRMGPCGLYGWCNYS